MTHIDITEAKTASDLLAGLRKELRAATARGDITDFAVRKGGRATLYWPDGTKSYTTGILDTLTVLYRRTHL